MVIAYHRPQTLDEALALLTPPNALPLGGGAFFSTPQADSVSAVDLQNLGLDSLRVKGNELEIGATVKLQTLLESEYCHAMLKSALKLEAPLNLRNSATVAGALVSCDGRSPFATAFLALDAKLSIANSKPEIVNFGDFLPLRPRGLITQITIPLNVKFAFEIVARTPADKPIVCAALTQWKSGRTRLALGGYAQCPTLALDGTESNGVETAASAAYHAANDEWASAEYRANIAAVLARRCLEKANE